MAKLCNSVVKNGMTARLERPERPAQPARPARLARPARHARPARPAITYSKNLSENASIL